MTSGAPAAAGPGTLSIATRFGRLDADWNAVVHFPSGLPGFEHCRQFVVLSSPTLGELRALHALDGGALFFAVDPRAVLPDYRAEPGPRDRARLGAAAGECLLWLALVTFGPDGASEANLRAPVVINPRTMIGIQSLPHGTLYPLRHPVALP
jgi:flagellar assembly factor FliW